MSKISTWALVPLLMIGLVGTSFTVCQGFMTEGAELGFIGNCESDTFCQQMCQLTQSDFPALAEKTSSQITKAAVVALVFVSALDIENPLSPWLSTHSAQEFPDTCASAEVYLLNAALLI